MQKREEKVASYGVDFPNSTYAAAVRAIYSRLSLMHDPRPPQVVLVTSAGAGEGKSTTSLSLARQVAQADLRVILIDADFHRSSIGRLSGVDSASGLGELLAGVATREEVTKRDPRSTADIIVAGDDPSQGLALADSRRFKQLLDELRASYDMIVIDSAPVFDLADANILSAVADATLMIVQWGSTPRRVFLYSIEKIAQLGGRIDGLVISKIDVKRYAVYGYGDLIAMGGASIGHRSTLLRFGLVTAGITALAAGVVAWQLTRPYLVPSENHAELPAPSPSLVEPDPSPMPEPTSGEPPVTQPMTSGDSVTAVDRPALKSEVAPVPAAMAPESSTPPTPSEEPDSSFALPDDDVPMTAPN